MSPSAIQIHQILEAITKTTCDKCDIVHCMGKGYDAVMQIMCEQCLRILVKVSVFRTQDPLRQSPKPPLMLHEYCPYGQRVVVNFRAHYPSDIGFQECLHEQMGKKGQWALNVR